MLRDRVMDEGGISRDQDRFDRQDAPAPTGMGAAPDGGDASGSEPPPASAGDEAPTPHFPVPPVPPPPATSGGAPIFGLVGQGGGGAASFARPGSQAAKPFRSPIFNANRSTAA